MAKQFGVIHFFGKIGDVVGYRDANGVPRVRKNTNLNKERLHADPKFAGSRTAWPYLAMSSAAGAAIRHALFPLGSHNKDRQTATRLVSLCHRALRYFHPDETPEVFPFGQVKSSLEGFAFLKENCISRFTGRIEATEPEPETGTIDIRVNEWTISTHEAAAKYVTHFRWRVIVAALPSHPTIQRHYEIFDSPWFPISEKQPWTCQVPYAEFLPEDGHVIIAIASESAQICNGIYETLQPFKSLNILKII